MRSFLLLGCVVLLLAGCGPASTPDSNGNSSAAPQPPQGSAPQTGEVPTIRISQGSDIISMDPYFKLESPTFTVQRNIMEPLIGYNGTTFELEPVLATTWKNTSSTSWELTLRENVKFHEGQPFASNDVIYSLRRALEWPQTRVSSEIQTVKSVSAPTSFSILIETHVPDAVLPRRLASIMILDQEWCEANIAREGDAFLATHVNGTGPYRLEQWSKDNPCILMANETYWGAQPEVQRVIFDPTPVDTTRMAALKRGDIDLMMNVPPRFVAQIEAVPGYQLVRQPGMRLIYLGADTKRDQSPGVPQGSNPLKDPRVRRAIYLAIDNRLIVKTIMGGNAEPCDQLLPPGVLGHLKDFSPPPRPDLAEARRLLAEAGFANGFRIRLDGPNDRYMNDAQIMQAVAQQLAQVGIQVDVNARPKVQFFADEEKANMSFYLIGWANTNGDGVGTFDHLLHTPDPARKLGVANTTVGYSNPGMDALVDQASHEFDPAKRIKLLESAHQEALKDLPHIPLHVQADLYAISNKFSYTPRRDNHMHCDEIKLAQ